MHLEDERRPAAFEPVDDRCTPTAAALVEARHCRVGGDPARTRTSRLGRARPGGGTRGRTACRPTSTAGRHATSASRPAGAGGDEVAPVSTRSTSVSQSGLRSSVSTVHDRRAQRRVLLDRPHERVGVAHLKIELAGPRHGPRLRYAPYFCKRPALASMNAMRSLVGRRPSAPAGTSARRSCSTSSRPQRSLHSSVGHRVPRVRGHLRRGRVVAAHRDDVGAEGAQFAARPRRGARWPGSCAARSPSSPAESVYLWWRKK